jgi:EpsI family protein
MSGPMQVRVRWAEWLALAGLLVAGGLAWMLWLKPPLRVDAAPLAALPETVDGWQGRDVPLESTVESMLQADFNVQRVYAHPRSGPIWVYVGYYGTARGGRPEHTPPVCYKAHGYRILDERVVTLDAARGLRVNQMLVEAAGHRDLVFYWYRSSRRGGLLDGLDLSLDKLASRLASGRADGALLRTSVELAGGDEDAARARLAAFSAALDDEVAAHWPRELPAGRSPVEASAGGGASG